MEDFGTLTKSLLRIPSPLARIKKKLSRRTWVLWLKACQKMRRKDLVHLWPPNLPNKEIRKTKTSTLICKSNFSDGSRISQTGTPTPEFDPNTYDLERFLPKTTWKWMKLGREGGARPWRPLGSTNAYQRTFQADLFYSWFRLKFDWISMFNEFQSFLSVNFQLIWWTYN